MIYLSAEQILFLHARLVAETGGSQGIRDLNLLLSAVNRSLASFNDQDLYTDVFLKAAALMDSLIRNHPFVDGNKRTGFAAATLFVLLNGYGLIVTNEEAIKFVLETARSEHSIDEIADWLRVYSKPIS
jgi:death on curing protein